MGLVCTSDWKRYNTDNFTEENKPFFTLQTNRSILFIEQKLHMLSRAKDLQYPGVRKNGLGYFCFLPSKVTNARCKFYGHYYPNIFFIRSKDKRVEGVFCPGAANISMSNVP